MPPCCTALPDWHDYKTLLVGWPLRGDTWRENATPAQCALIQFIRNVLRETKTTHVNILVDDDDAGAHSVRKRLVAMPSDMVQRTSVTRVPMNDCWIRDTGPIILSHGRGACFRFNAWGGINGGCYSDFRQDERLKVRLCERLGLKCVRGEKILEGGAVSTDGEGTLITTRECVLNANRKGGMSEKEIEKELRRVLGVEKVIWLEYGAAFDWDVDGHVDNMAVFVGSAHVVLLWAGENECKEQNKRSRKALEVLEKSRDAKGRRIRVSKVSGGVVVVRSEREAGGVETNVMEGVRERQAGERVCASYVNFVMMEDVVFVPGFGDMERDERAMWELCEVFGEYGKRVVMVNAREFVLSGGGLHCLTLGVRQEKEAAMRDVDSFKGKGV